MAHRRSFGRSGRGISETQRRKKVWIDMNVAPSIGDDISGGFITPAPLVAPGSSVAALTFPSSTNPSFAESTLLRVRGTVDIPKNSGNILTDIIVNAFGIGIISEQASTVLTAIPNPATASGYDWDGWMFLRSSFQTAVDVQGTMVDVKAMRKWKSGDAIVFVAGLATNVAAGAAVTPTNFSLRGLFLLP